MYRIYLYIKEVFFEHLLYTQNTKENKIELLQNAELQTRVKIN